MAVGRTAGRTLFRRRGNQGAPYKCPVLREKLWDWFVDMRRSIASTISPKFVLLKAKSMAKDGWEFWPGQGVKVAAKKKAKGKAKNRARVEAEEPGKG